MDIRSFCGPSGGVVVTAKVAAVQMSSGPEVAQNLEQASELIGRAAALGARLVVLPENFALMPRSDRDRLAAAESAGSGPIQDFLADQARTHGLWIVGGTIPILSVDAPGRVRAACLVYDAHGVCAGRYDKIHLFDVDLKDQNGTGERYRESDSIEAGSETVVLDSPFGRLGLAVCYDLRFPELYRRLLAAGSELYAIPSAFTVRTGQAHWEMLVRARAVENLAYVIAAAQWGTHANGRSTYGHSMIVDPWGTILAELASGPGVAVADLERPRLEHLRASFPSIRHRRLHP